MNCQICHQYINNDDISHISWTQKRLCAECQLILFLSRIKQTQGGGLKQGGQKMQTQGGGLKQGGQKMQTQGGGLKQGEQKMQTQGRDLKQGEQNSSLQFLDDQQQSSMVFSLPIISTLQGGNDPKFKSPCPFCNKEFLYIKSHINNCKKNPDYRQEFESCSFCQKKITIDKVKRHEHMCNFNPNKIQQSKCKYCGKIMSRKSNMPRHLKTCKGFNLQKPKSGGGGRAKQGGGLKQERQDNKQVGFNAPESSMDFLSMPKDSEFGSCSFCQKKITIEKVKRHEDICNFNPNKKASQICEYCGKTLSRKSDMPRHLTTCKGFNFPEQKPSGGKSAKTKCNFCKRFYTNIKTHQRLHCHLNPNKKSKEKCPFCFKLYISTHICKRRPQDF